MVDGDVGVGCDVLNDGKRGSITDSEEQFNEMVALVKANQLQPMFVHDQVNTLLCLFRIYCLV